MGLLRSNIFNLIFFNLLWLILVLGRNEFLWFSAPLVLAYAGVLVATGTIRPAALLVPALLGLIIDALLVSAGLFDFSPHELLPAWMAVLWLLFASTLSLSLRWLAAHFWVTALAGGLAFPLNYRLGEALGAVSFAAPTPLVLATLAAIWMVGLPLLFWFTRLANSPRSMSVLIRKQPA